jgi:hypothetical protein
VRSALVTALASLVDCRQRTGIRKFLLGLSGDELQYIAEFLGACILEFAGPAQPSRAQLAASIAEFEETRRHSCPFAGGADLDHKMILLLEYMSRSRVWHSVATS